MKERKTATGRTSMIFLCSSRRDVKIQYNKIISTKNNNNYSVYLSHGFSVLIREHIQSFNSTFLFYLLKKTLNVYFFLLLARYSFKFVKHPENDCANVSLGPCTTRPLGGGVGGL